MNATELWPPLTTQLAYLTSMVEIIPNMALIAASMNLPYWEKRFVKFGSYLDS